MMLWPTTGDAKNAEEVARVKAFHTFHHGMVPTKDDVSTFGPGAVVREQQLNHYLKKQKMMNKELSVMAWCGGLYENSDLYAYVREGSTTACSYTPKQMNRWLPKVLVGATFRTAYRYKPSPSHVH